MTKAVGIIGVGKMGLPIAVNLMERGWEVLGYRRSSLQDFMDAGGRAVASPAEIGAACDLVITILPDASALDSVLHGPNGLLVDPRPGLVVIEMSTLLEADKRRALEAVSAAGGDLLDCPISGIPMMIKPRLATVFASGDPSVIDRAAPVLDDIGPWQNVGPFGDGAKLKYVANLLVSVHNAVTAEAMAFAVSVGLDPQLVLDAVTGTIASSTTLERRAPMMLAGEWDQRPGPIETMHDILVQIEATAAVYDADTPVFDASKQLYDSAMADGWGSLDISSLFLRLQGAGHPDAPPPDAPPPDAPQSNAAATDPKGIT